MKEKPNISNIKIVTRTKKWAFARFYVNISIQR